MRKQHFFFIATILFHAALPLAAETEPELFRITPKDEGMINV